VVPSSVVAAASLNNNSAYDAFVSFASADRALAEQLVTLLAADGLRVWISYSNLTPGSAYAEGIVRAIAESRTVLVLVSPAAVDSAHVAREVAEAARLSRRMLPIFVEDKVELSAQLRYYLGPLHRLKLRRGEELETATARIAAGIRSPERWLAESTAASPIEKFAVSPKRMGVTLVVTGLVAGAITWGLQALRDARREAVKSVQPDSLAQVQLVGAARSPAGQPGDRMWELTVDVTLMSPQTRFADLRVGLASRQTNGVVEQFDFTAILERTKAQMGGAQRLSVHLPVIGSRITACVWLPHPSTTKVWRVSEAFDAQEGSDSDQRVFLRAGRAVSEPNDGKTCG
jgi:hypothetical protein